MESFFQYKIVCTFFSWQCHLIPSGRIKFPHIHHIQILQCQETGNTLSLPIHDWHFVHFCLSRTGGWLKGKFQTSILRHKPFCALTFAPTSRLSITSFGMQCNFKQELVYCHFIKKSSPVTYIHSAHNNSNNNNNNNINNIFLSPAKLPDLTIKVPES